MVLQTGAGLPTVFGGSGPEQIGIGTGGLVFVGSSSTSGVTVTGTATSGGATLFGAANNDITFSSTSTVAGALILGGSGAETLSASGTTSFIYAGSGNDSLIGGSGTNNLVAGVGADTLVGGSGTTNFTFSALYTAGQHDYVMNFQSQDYLFAVGYASTVTSASLIANATVANNQVTLTLSDQTKITFTNVSSASTLSGHIVT
jgi:Ca2+-binding RTX toxin-like protein